MNKTCSKCGVEQPETNFSKDSSSLCGLQCSCKNCARAYYNSHREHYGEYRKRHYIENREAIIRQTKAWKENNPEARQKANALWNVNNKERKRIADAEWRKNNKEYKQQKDAAYHQSHREERRIYNKENREKILIYAATRRKKRPNLFKLYNHTRTAKKAGLDRTLTPGQWDQILESFNNTCAYCGVRDKSLHQDHFIPLSSDGEYTHNNIIPTCKSCNSSKGAKDFFTWYPTTNYYDKQREKKIMKFLHYSGSAQQLALW